ncbi:DUF7266 family protein [Halococcoides cellulosivorans]|uniref:Uncharacterized protein n=1 Tax=Halococcoides cellulosivorans TaxID=1679096 RepID=A0A2R4WXJ7_9EURY|nr:hypothetical protein [Halococcoides cellulosivorans]AWB26240.1 hypothetical protein HARCEL1_00145 [Halococcoides cellulosivorans]
MDDRAASTVFAHALVIAIALILLVVAFTAATTYLDNERDRVVNTQLEVVNERVAGCLQSAQRTVDSASAPTYEKTCDLPRRIAGTSYTIDIETSPASITLRSDRVPRSPTIDLGPTVSLAAEYELPGGPITVSNSGGDLEVTNG